MVVSTEVVARKYLDVSAGTPISVDFPVLQASDVHVYYGKEGAEAPQDTYYTVGLAEDFETFTVTPTAALITAIDALIAADATEVNYITVRRELEYTTEATAAGVRYTPFTAREFDRNAMRDMQLADQGTRSLRFPRNDIASDIDGELRSVLPGQYLRRSDDGGSIIGASVDIQVTEVDAWFSQRNAASAEQGAALADGSVFAMNGRLYETDSGTTTLSATYDLGVQGVKPHGDATYAHFGADNTGAADSTANLKRMVTWAQANKRWHDWGDGTYKVSGALFTDFSVAEAAFLMRGGAVKINVDAAATPFEYLFYMESTAIADAIIDVAFLVVDGNDRTANAFLLRHHGAVGGVAANKGLVWIKNIYQSDVSATREHGGLGFLGAFRSIEWGRGVVENVGRAAGANISGVATYGLSASGFEDTAPVSGWTIDTVHCGSAANVDADGVKLFGRNAGTQYNAREGHAVVRDCRFRNCMGRGVKFQTQGTVEDCEFVLEDTAVIANGLHIDFQTGAGRVSGCRFAHLQAGGTNPFTTGTSFSMIGCQLAVDDHEIAHRITDCELVFDVACPRMVTTVPSSRQRDGAVDVRGFRLIPAEGNTGSAFSRAVVEVSMGSVFAASPNTTRISVSGVVGPTGVPLIGHTGFSQSAGTTVTGATQADPCVITAVGHGFQDGARVAFSGVGGMTELNGTDPVISVLTDDTFELVGVDSAGYSAFTSGGTVTYSNQVFFFEAVGNEDTSSANKRPIYSVSGDALIDMTRLRMRDNAGFQNLYGGVVFDIDDLPAGTHFSVTYGSGTITDAPATWNAGGQTWDYADIETKPDYLGSGYVNCRFTIHDSNTVPVFFEKYSSGSNWTEYRANAQQTVETSLAGGATLSDVITKVNNILIKARAAGWIDS